jgi:hypothetical protein
VAKSLQENRDDDLPVIQSIQNPVLIWLEEE